MVAAALTLLDLAFDIRIMLGFAEDGAHAFALAQAAVVLTVCAEPPSSPHLRSLPTAPGSRVRPRCTAMRHGRGCSRCAGR